MSRDQFMCRDVDKLVKEAQIQIGNAQKKQALHCNMHRSELEIKVGHFDFLENFG